MASGELKVLTMEYIRTFVMRKLGDGSVVVELRPEHIDVAIKQACDLFTKHVPSHRANLLPGGSTPGRYVLTQVAYPGLISVIRVSSVRNRMGTAKLDLFDPLIYMANGAASATDGAGSYLMAMQSIKNARRIFSAETEWRGGWEYDPDTDARQYVLYIDMPTITMMTFGFEYLAGYTADDDKKTGVSYIEPDKHEPFLEYVLAQCKMTLAKIRGKFQGIPSPEGSDMLLDSDILQQEGQTAIEKIEAQMEGVRNSLPIMFG